MTNEQKYKTAEERTKAFEAFCDSHDNCKSCEIIDCAMKWLALEAEAEKPEPCPFCGGKTETAVEVGGDVVKCKCGYHTIFCGTTEMAIAAHNRVARAVRAAEKGETK